MLILRLLLGKHPILFKVLFLIFGFILWILGVESNQFFDSIGYKCYLQTDDETDIKKEDSSTSKGKSTTNEDLSASKDKSTNSIVDKEKDNSSFRVGDLPASSGVAHADLLKRMEQLMLDHTAQIMNEEDSEIKAKNLHTKPESELTQEEYELLKYREANAKHMAETSARFMKMESESAITEQSVDGNINKRDVKSADMSLDKEDNKKPREE